MLEKDDADDLVVPLAAQLSRALACQREPGHDIVDDDDPIAVRVGDERTTVRRVSDAQERVGMGMVDVARGDQCVQDRFHRRRRRIRAGARQLQLLRHYGVGQLGQLGQLEEVLEANGREAGFGDRGEVRARTLDVEHVDGPAEQVGL